MATTLPNPPTLVAGQVATAAQMNALAYTAQFALNKPYTRVHATVAQNITLTTGTPVVYSTVDTDTDGMWSAGSPSQLTIQTGGYYKFRQMTNCGNFGCQAQMQVTTGANNPLGAGQTFTQWGAYVLGGSTNLGALGGSGVLEDYLWPGDFVQVMAFRPAGSFTTVITDVTSWLSLEWVSL